MDSIDTKNGSIGNNTNDKTLEFMFNMAVLNKINLFCNFMVYRMYKNVQEKKQQEEEEEVFDDNNEIAFTDVNYQSDEYYVTIPCDYDRFKEIEKSFGEDHLTKILRESFPGWTWDAGDYGITEEGKKCYLFLPLSICQNLHWDWCQRARTHLRSKHITCVSKWEILKNDLFNAQTTPNNQIVRIIGLHKNPFKHAFERKIAPITTDEEAKKQKIIIVHFSLLKVLVYSYKLKSLNEFKQYHRIILSLLSVLNIDDDKKNHNEQLKLEFDMSYPTSSFIYDDLYDSNQSLEKNMLRARDYLAFRGLFSLDEFHFEKTII